ncbi:NAD kinase [Methyloversatilis sp. NSM2]|uniref:NAD kinase n=1 Tax=Methyloversatilis sp. NSM2 TaxID=3134135 RepID=UPI0031150CC0
MKNESPAFGCVALIGKYQSAEVAESLRALAHWLSESGREVLIEQASAEVLPDDRFEAADFDTLGRRAKLAVVVGGDGSLISAARKLAPHDVPLVGINQGRLGFLTDVARSNMLAAMESLMHGQFRPERRALMQASVLRDGAEVFSAFAFNDVVISKGDLGRMIEFEMRVDDEFVYSQRSDGLIVSTPTGSTAYSLSANGPILHPSLGGMLIVPLCPHALSSRPIVLGDSAVLKVRLFSRHDARAHFDGQEHCNLQGDDVLRIERSPYSVTLLHPPGYSYFSMLREKLRWSEAPKEV